MPEKKLSTLSLLSIGIGGMVGGGIFAVTGLAIELTKGAAPVAFLVAGFIALLTAYSYWKLSLSMPNIGGTVYFLNSAFGANTLTGGMNILLCISYVVLIAIYAYAFGMYSAYFFKPAWYPWVIHVLMSGVIILLTLMNIFNPASVIRSENFFNIVKLLLLGLFIVWGLSTPLEWQRMSTENWVEPVALFSGAMIIFLNYEGFELISNAGPNIKNPRTSLPIAYMGGVLVVIAMYFLISTVVIGHMSFTDIAQHSDSVLSAAAATFMGCTGKVIISMAAMLATSSAINATFYGSGSLAFTIAKSGELPKKFEKKYRKMPIDGLLMFSFLSLVIVNLVPLGAIALMGSAGFLIIFMMVNLANVKLYKKTESSIFISLFGAISCAAALMALLYSVFIQPDIRWHLYILFSMVAFSLFAELFYRQLAK